VTFHVKHEAVRGDGPIGIPRDSLDAGGAPPPPAVAEAVFGARLDLAVRYADLLATTGIAHGLIGPREAARVWDRHLLNCAVVGGLIPQGATVADIGSGAGLPGLVLAIVRPDVRMTLVEPLERRVRWLDEAVTALGLDTVTVVRARAEEIPDRFDVVTARAVAPLSKLARWCLPLVTPGGALLALKGSQAQAELAEAEAMLRRLGGGESRLEICGVGVVDPPTTVVAVTRSSRQVSPGGRPGQRGRGPGPRSFEGRRAR
jgi:16S rRNA (guanine527-N7)-methyltransferase